MQIASLFAKAGFQVDKTGLQLFRVEMDKVKREMTETLKVMGRVNASLKGVSNRFRSIQGLFDPSKMTAWRTAIGAATRQYVRTITASSAAIDKLATVAQADATKLNRFHAVLENGVGKITTYAQAIYHLEQALRNLRGVPPIPLPNPNRGAGGRGSGQGGTNPQGGGNRSSTSFLEALGLGTFLKPMLPTGIGIGGMLGSGYAVKELIATGREIMAVELKMKAVSRTSAEFGNNMAFVSKVANEMGLDLTQATNAYANIVVSAQEKLNPIDMQKMFYGFNKYYTAVHMTMEDQRLANLAIQQMFGKDKIQAQEARLQMGQRVTPFIKLLTQAAKEQLGSKFTTFDDVMKKGLLDPSKLLPIVAEKLGKIADQNNAYAEALHNSQVAQQRFTNEMKKTAYAIMKGGLDKALATLFNGLNALLSALKPVGRFIQSFLATLSRFIDLWKAMPGTMSAALVGLLLWQAGLVKVAISLATVIFRITTLNWAMIRLMGIMAPLILMFSELDGYFKGDTDNWATVLGEAFQVVLSYVGLISAKISQSFVEIEYYMAKYGTLGGIFKGAKYLLENEQGQMPGKDYIPRPSLMKAVPGMMLPAMVIDAVNGWLKEGSGFQTPQTPTTPALNKPQSSLNISVDVSGMSPQAQEAFRNGDMYEFGRGVGSVVSVGGLAFTPVS